MDPRLQQLLHPVVLLDVLTIQAVVVVEILRAWHELFQGFRAILRQREVLDVTDLLGLHSPDQHDQRTHDNSALHLMTGFPSAYLAAVARERCTGKTPQTTPAATWEMVHRVSRVVPDRDTIMAD